LERLQQYLESDNIFNRWLLIWILVGGT
jgi:hypothetical protein